MMMTGKPSDYGIDIPDEEIALAMAELIAAGLLVPAGIKFVGGKWRTLWALAERESRQ